MSDWHPFGYEGKPGTCKWCGRKLRRKSVVDKQLEARLEAQGVPRAKSWQQALVPAEKLGTTRTTTSAGCAAATSSASARPTSAPG
jgi:hypothetical protein